MSIHPLHGTLVGPLGHLKPVLFKWRSLMQKLAAEWAPEGDAPWWYRERTLVGFCSASVWKCGGEAIEEYMTDKKSKNKRRRKKRAGRGDLMFSVKGKWYVAEAKQSEISLNLSPKELKHKIAHLLRKAREDAVRTPNYGYASRLGMVFLTPYSTYTNGAATESDAPTAKQLREWIGRIKELQASENATIAWTFPSKAWNLKWKDRKEDKHYFYPGAALLIKKPRL